MRENNNDGFDSRKRRFESELEIDFITVSCGILDLWAAISAAMDKWIVCSQWHLMYALWVLERKIKLGIGDWGKNLILNLEIYMRVTQI